MSGFPLVFTALNNLTHPAFLEMQTAVLEAARGSSEPMDVRLSAWFSAYHCLQHGQVEAGLEALDHLRVGSWQRTSIPYHAHVSGLPVPTERLDSWLAEASATEPEDRIGIDFVRGALALERDRADDYEQARLALETIAEEALATGDTVTARWVRGDVRGLEGFAAWRAGRREEAERALEEARVQALGFFFLLPDNRIIRWWLAKLALENGQLDRAEELFFSLAHMGDPGFVDPMAVLQLAQVQEQLGSLDEARANYEWFVLAYRYADPELQPLVEDATARLLRLRDDIGE
jgi:hypothetical protein